ncbi:MAG: hypothetical protein O0X93_04645 [Methanocorpusculum sp.]|uniref:Uncharacterized protein n=1 Tax=Methanocorpusculum petauri TaxID=3002863 RepID=A0ABT4IF97_9EURY|nr:hypothetical protein [Methanocorpusculum petauri]MDE2443353.1 hypothetical protein [Methanocorpusculum sp.]MCZ0860390.1 hypothetical protein [Methanocorpusculum petauri]MDE2518079.1 hypothetical protein [Methanocorpusculum sp.]MDE2522439.1 hypothetical protein [Methanocorpusculum sp.]MDE2524797.1 hypothetical protein [Methanocorpusculum sp.]
MKKSTALALGILFAAIAIVAALFVAQIPALIAVVVISVPAALASLIYWWCAGTKDGDIPFVGY